jgi:hypothetical protein
MRCNAAAAISGLFLGLFVLPHLGAQATPPASPSNAMPESLLPANPSSTNNAAPAVPATPSGQAPEEMTHKISELVHAGKYTEAQQLTNGLLIAYPDDQRLIKAKVLIDKLLSSGGSTNTAPTTSQTPQPATSADAEHLTGMDKVDYNALIVLAREAQQTTDLDEQKRLLKQFMDQSNAFLEKHPDQMLLWQLRAASAISLNDPLAGYEAGQRLLAAGAAETNDSALQQLLGQLKNKGWFEKQEAEKQAQKRMEYLSILGTWKGHLSRADHKGHEIAHFDWTIEFSKVQSGMEGYVTTANGKREDKPTLRGTILDSGEISWERRWDSEWIPVQIETDNDHRTMKYAFNATIKINFNAFNTNGTPEQCTQTITLTKVATPTARGSAPLSRRVQPLNAQHGQHSAPIGDRAASASTPS